MNHNPLLKFTIQTQFKTQFKFAQLVKIREGRLSHIITGRVVPTVGEKRKMARRLNMTVEELFPRK